MALIIRMRQQGASSRQCFRIVLANARDPRDGKYMEKLGWYNPFAPNEKGYFLDVPRIQHWLGLGAQISDRVKALVERMAPEVIQAMTQKEVEKRAKARAKRKQA
jgi:small subunit ribosomal protein S16